MEKENWEFEAACKTVSLADLRKLIDETSEAVDAYELLIDQLKDTLGKLVFQLGDLMEAATEQGIAEVVDDVDVEDTINGRFDRTCDGTEGDAANE